MGKNNKYIFLCVQNNLENLVWMFPAPIERTRWFSKELDDFQEILFFDKYEKKEGENDRIQCEIWEGLKSFQDCKLRNEKIH